MFHQFELTSDSDENFWSIQYPALLIKAALYQLSTLMQGSNEFTKLYNAIKIEAMNVEFDYIASIAADVDQMEG